jgi:hypothetical protein
VQAFAIVLIGKARSSFARRTADPSDSLLKN